MLDGEVALVIDDSSTVRRIIATILRDYLNCDEILEAADGHEAIKRLRGDGERIGWIFCDWEMPGLTGDAFLLEVRNYPATQTTPFIMITTRADRESLITAASAGVDAYVVKPFTATTLIEKVRGILHRQERRRAERVKSAGRRIEVELVLEGNGGRGTCELLDLSASGVLLQVGPGISRGAWIYDRAQITMELPAVKRGDGASREQIQLLAEVVRIEAHALPDHRNDAGVSMAFRFDSPDQDTKRKLAALKSLLLDQATVPAE
ncbi:MAG: response regulator [Pseudomonadota bacterium]